MNKVQQRQFGRLRRINEFFVERAGDFSEGSRAKVILGDLQGVLSEVESQGPNGGKTNVKADGVNKKALLNDLREELVAIERTARAIEKHNPDFAGKFVLPSDKRKKDDLADAAQGFIDDAAKAKDEFLAYEMSDDFLERLQERLEAYKATQAPVVRTGRGRRASASGETIGRGLELAADLDIIVGNKYRGQDEVLAVWRDANRATEAPRGRGRRAGRPKGTGKPGRPAGSVARKPRTPRSPAVPGRRPGRPPKVKTEG